MPLKLMLGSLPWLLQVMGAEGGLSCWGWCRVDIPGHRGAGGHSQGPSGVQSSRNRGAVRFGIASIPVCLQCQLLPPAGQVWCLGPFCQPLHMVPVERWCHAAPGLGMAPALLLHSGQAGGSATQTGTQQHQVCPAPSAPSPRLPTPPTPQPHTNTHSHPISFTQNPAATIPASCESWPRDHELPAVLQPCPSLLLLPSTVMDAGALCPPSLSPSHPAAGFAPGQRRAGSRAHFPRASAAGGRTWAHTSLPAAPPAPAPPPPADKAQPDKATTSLAGPACGKASEQPRPSPAGTRSL